MIKITGSYGTRSLLAFGVLGGWLGLPSALVDSMSVTGTDNWDESILLLNPNNQTVDVKLTFMFPDRRPKVVTRRVAANSRRTIFVDRLVRAGPVSVKVESSPAIVAERTIYFAHGSDGGGDNSIGARSPSRSWYLAEGKTGPDYDTYLLIMNPRSAPTMVTATFMPGSGILVRKRINVPALARREIKVDDIPGLDGAPAPAVVTSPNPIVVERSTYVDRNGVTGGATTVGSRTLAKTWYFAEGFTGSGFDARLLVFNPAEAATTITVALNAADGAAVTRGFTIDGRSRKEINLNNLLDGSEFGITVTAAAGVVAERTTYFNSGGKSGMSGTIGSPNAAKTWYFAEGNTGTGFDEFLTVLNPSDSVATLTVRYLSEGGGAPITRVHTVAPHSRKTITVGGAGELGAGRGAGAEISSDQPLVAERVMYFTYSGNHGQSTWTGGHVTIGATAPSLRWLFAEGNTQ